MGSDDDCGAESLLFSDVKYYVVGSMLQSVSKP